MPCCYINLLLNNSRISIFFLQSINCEYFLILFFFFWERERSLITAGWSFFKIINRLNDDTCYCKSMFDYRFRSIYSGPPGGFESVRDTIILVNSSTTQKHSGPAILKNSSITDLIATQQVWHDVNFILEDESKHDFIVINANSQL